MPARTYDEKAVGAASIGDALEVLLDLGERVKRKRTQEATVAEARKTPGSKVQQAYDAEGRETTTVTQQTATAQEQQQEDYQGILKGLFDQQQSGEGATSFRIVPGEKGFTVQAVDHSKSLRALVQDRAIKMTGKPADYMFNEKGDPVAPAEGQQAYRAALEENLRIAAESLGYAGELGDFESAAEPQGTVTTPGVGSKLLRLMTGSPQAQLALLLGKCIKRAVGSRQSEPEAGTARAVSQEPAAAPAAAAQQFKKGQQVRSGGKTYVVSGFDPETGEPLFDPVS